MSSNAQIAAAEKFKAPGASAPTTKETEQDMNVEDGDDGDSGEEVSVYMYIYIIQGVSSIKRCCYPNALYFMSPFVLLTRCMCP